MNKFYDNIEKRFSNKAYIYIYVYIYVPYNEEYLAVVDGLVYCVENLGYGGGEMISLVDSIMSQRPNWSSQTKSPPSSPSRPFGMRYKASDFSDQVISLFHICGH